MRKDPAFLGGVWDRIPCAYNDISRLPLAIFNNIKVHKYLNTVWATHNFKESSSVYFFLMLSLVYSIMSKWMAEKTKQTKTASTTLNFSFLIRSALFDHSLNCSLILASPASCHVAYYTSHCHLLYLFTLWLEPKVRTMYQQTGFHPALHLFREPGT